MKSAAGYEGRAVVRLQGSRWSRRWRVVVVSWAQVQHGGRRGVARAYIAAWLIAALWRGR